MADEEEGELFIIHWERPAGDATDMVLCEYCGATRYSSAENLRAARGRKMHIACLNCCMALAEKDTVLLSGSIRFGAVIERRR
jgi:hypothetical protein